MIMTMYQPSPPCSFTTVASIDAWIDTVPFPRRQVAVTDSGCKRKPDATSQSLLPKRAALTTLAEHGINKREINRPIMTGSPSKRQRLASNTTIAEDPGIDEDVFVTPRPRMPQPRASKSETSSNRSQSPVKMQELASLHSGGSAYVDLDSLRDVTADHPLHELLALLKRVKSFSLGSGVVTEARKVCGWNPGWNKAQFGRLTYRVWVAQEELKRDADTWEVFENSQHSFDDTGSRENYGATPSLEEALRMRKESRVCRLRQEPEPAWNERVHYPLLRMALDKSPHGTSLEVANVYV